MLQHYLETDDHLDDTHRETILLMYSRQINTLAYRPQLYETQLVKTKKNPGERIFVLKCFYHILIF